jgi:hypothetical protein
LTYELEADILSDMRTFTLRDMDRQPRELIKACEREGAIRIQLRDGRAYRLTPESEGTNRPLPDFRARMKSAGIKRLSVKQTRRLFKMIAGE